MKRVIFYVVCSIAMLCFVGCHKKTMEVNVIKSGTYTDVNLSSGMTIRIPETYLRSGDTLIIELAHKDPVPVDIISSTLRLDENVVTDTVLRKVVNITGWHDIVFEYDYEDDSWSDTARIEVR